VECGSGTSWGAGDRVKIIASYLAIYIIWGSTYLAISISIKTLPIFFASAARFLTAGLALMVYSFCKGAGRPTWKNISIAVKSGFMAFFISYGLLAWAEQILPSSVAALIVSIEPSWFVLFDWIFFSGPRPNARVAAAQVIGFMGCAILIFGGGIPEYLSGAPGMSATRYVASAAAVIVSGFTWVYGVLMSSKSRDSHSDSAMASGLQMLFGGIFFIMASAARAEFPHIAEGSAESWIATVYLIVFGSILAYSGYVYLLRREPSARVTTHTFVNPVVAVVLGWAVAGEEITRYTVLSATLVVVSVILTIYSSGSAPKH
jgi:drug/metabolite transporter (DMT)-like permease